MPRYDYQCPKCKAVDTKWHKMTEKPLFVCSICKKEILVKQLSTSTIIFKGSGWATKPRRT